MVRITRLDATRGATVDSRESRERETGDVGARHAFLDGRRMPCGKAGYAMGVHPNSLRYGATTGRILLRWDGARDAVVWTRLAPSLDAMRARLELARRYLHVFGPSAYMAPRVSRGLDRFVASPLGIGARGRRGGGDIAAAAGARRSDHGSLLEPVIQRSGRPFAELALESALTA
jgi:hypothetical protein